MTARTSIALLVAAAVGTAYAQFGRGSMSDEEAAHMASGGQGFQTGGAAVDRAMGEWAKLASNPQAMQEVVASFNDPEVKARAKEMLNDPEYMKMARRKMQEIERTAQAKGLLDAEGRPVPGAAQAGGANSYGAEMMQALLGANGGATISAGGAGGAGAQAAAMAQLQRENAALKAKLGI